MHKKFDVTNIRMIDRSIVDAKDAQYVPGENLKASKIQHVGIIMDGNGR